MKLNGFNLIGVLLMIMLFSCSSPTNSNPKVAGHEVKRGGVYHKTGLTNPTANCLECHGNDLRGGTSEVSCYDCHGKKW